MALFTLARLGPIVLPSAPGSWQDAHRPRYVVCTPDAVASEIERGQVALHDGPAIPFGRALEDGGRGRAHVGAAMGASETRSALA